MHLTGNMQLFCFQIIFLALVCARSVNAVSSVTFLEPGSYSHILPELGRFGYNVEKMNIFCYTGRQKDIASLLQTIKLNIDIDSEDFNLFPGSTPEDVEQAHQNHKSIFSFSLFSTSKKRTAYVNPFNETCVGIETAEEYKVSLNLIRLDFFKLALLVGGILVFFTAPLLSSNNIFFYLSGVSIGNFASVLVLVWFISKLFPRKPLMYGVLASGWTLTAYFAQIIYDNIRPIFVSYQKYVVMYVLAMSFISFAVCYYKGPPKHERTQDLIKWGLQVVALIAIFFSSDFREATIAIVIACIILYYIPLNFFGVIQRIWRRKFPPKIKFITKEEFHEQGREEAEKALKELREFVKSPQCKQQWKIVMNLSQPGRFASFVEGEQHVTLDETVAYENVELSTDESDDDSEEYDESLVVDENLSLIKNHKSESNKLTNGNSQSRLARPNQSFNRTPAQVTSSTPNGRSRRRESRPAQNTFEISDDE